MSSTEEITVNEIFGNVPMFTFKNLLASIAAALACLVFVYTGFASSNSYTDKKIAESEVKTAQIENIKMDNVQKNIKGIKIDIKELTKMQVKYGQILVRIETVLNKKL